LSSVFLLPAAGPGKPRVAYGLLPLLYLVLWFTGPVPESDLFAVDPILAPDSRLFA
jgi:hypothetical protein